MSHILQKKYQHIMRLKKVVFCPYLNVRLTERCSITEKISFFTVVDCVFLSYKFVLKCKTLKTKTIYIY